ncbi:hypothetical protein CEXT_424811 [Caerostris extrusa]|uniref:Uncharacterized protein n=1 Tax=Caerostris extrusa TaxID=172846 RepID=A0AAV4W7Z4_CAEEX|nr:hypothetical protein CEXT_424811 [Caerostris extrusa]
MGKNKKEQNTLLFLFGCVRDEKVRQSCCVRIAALLATVQAMVGNILLRSNAGLFHSAGGCHLASGTETQWYAIPMSGTVRMGQIIKTCRTIEKYNSKKKLKP